MIIHLYCGLREQIRTWRLPLFDPSGSGLHSLCLRLPWIRFRPWSVGKVQFRAQKHLPDGF